MCLLVSVVGRTLWAAANNHHVWDVICTGVVILYGHTLGVIVIVC